MGVMAASRTQKEAGQGRPLAGEANPWAAGRASYDLRM